jgi:hypothetical protein
VPYDARRRARDSIIARIPGNIGAPEREARLCSPDDCLE